MHTHTDTHTHTLISYSPWQTRLFNSAATATTTTNCDHVIINPGVVIVVVVVSSLIIIIFRMVAVFVVVASFCSWRRVFLHVSMPRKFGALFHNTIKTKFCRIFEVPLLLFNTESSLVCVCVFACSCCCCCCWGRILGGMLYFIYLRDLFCCCYSLHILNQFLVGVLFF